MGVKVFGDEMERPAVAVREVGQDLEVELGGSVSSSWRGGGEVGGGESCIVMRDEEVVMSMKSLAIF